MQDIICQKCGTVNEYYTTQAGPHISAYCSNCSFYIKHLPKGGAVTIHFGKYKGRLLSSLTSDEEIRYLRWLSSDGTSIKANLKESILSHLKTV